MFDNLFYSTVIGQCLEVSRRVPLRFCSDLFPSTISSSHSLLIFTHRVWFFLPETSKRSLESLDDMFSLPWYLIGRKGAQLTEDHSHLAVVEKEEALQMEYVEEVPNKRSEL